MSTHSWLLSWSQACVILILGESMLRKRIIVIIVDAATLFALLVSPHSSVQGDELRQIAQPYGHSLLRWEVSNLLNKGIWRLQHLGRAGLSAGERIQVVKDYFSLGQEVNAIQREMERVSIVYPRIKSIWSR